MKKTLLLLVTLGTFLVSGLLPCEAENWPQWRGAKLDGVSHEKGLPLKWSKTENIAWRLPLPGPGGATPVIWDDRVFVSSTEGDQLVLLCISTSGKLLWKRVVSEGNKVVRGDEGNAASPSPSTDGKHVWVMFTNGALACYSVDGDETWKIDLQERFGKFRIAFGMTSTPVLDGERIYLQLIHGDGKADTREATIAAVDKSSGTTIWKTGRPSEAYAENEHSYASPVLYRDKERAYLLSHGADYIVAHNLEDGSELWRCGGLHPPTGELSPHLKSRAEVGRILIDSGVPTIVLQAGVVIGSGSASFEMIRHLTNRLPVMTTPRWVHNRIQPIAVRDVLHYLIGAASALETALTVRTLQTGRIAPTANLTDPDPECDLDCVPLVGREAPGLEYALTNSFAFGGSNATLVLRKVLAS